MVTTQEELKNSSQGLAQTNATLGDRYLRLPSQHRQDLSGEENGLTTDPQMAINRSEMLTE